MSTWTIYSRSANSIDIESPLDVAAASLPLVDGTPPMASNVVRAAASPGITEPITASNPPELRVENALPPLGGVLSAQDGRRGAPPPSAEDAANEQLPTLSSPPGKTRASISC